MRAKITIEMDNEAFADFPGHEIARILGELSSRLKREQTDEWILHDINGNTVGKFEVEQ